MNKYFYLIFIFILVLKAEVYSQTRQFIVKKTSFSSALNDEFSPVFFKDGLVFCSNIRDNSLVSFKNGQNRLFKIVYVRKKGSKGWTETRLFSKSLISGFNDGPVTFNSDENVIYFCRNNFIGNQLKNMSDTSNKLGIYRAEMVNGEWTKISPFEYNNPLYTYYTPALSPDGKRIYFSSDMPGGYGGMDLYYCDSINNGWGQPLNFGPLINTSKNESFPFAGAYGKLFFASDGHKGLGGKDLFYTQELNGRWIDPVHLDSAINSPYDDFGLVADSAFQNGYFSSNRLKTDDIFSFNSPPVQFTSCDTIRENKYCFTFYDERHKISDTIPVTYLWDFGEGIKITGAEAKHCFPGPGDYSVKLSIFDELTGKPMVEMVEYKVRLQAAEQAYINSYNIGIVDNSLSFGGEISSLKNFSVTDYLWNFGDGFKPGGPSMTRSFKKNGEYIVQLGLLGEKDSLGTVPEKCYMKKIRIFGSYQELIPDGTGEIKVLTEKVRTEGKPDKTISVNIFLMDNLAEGQITQIKEKMNEFKEPVLNFNKYGILPSSYPLLDNIHSVLNDDPEIRVEISIHKTKDELKDETLVSELWAQELTFYFRNKKIRKDVFNIQGIGSSPSIFKPRKPDGKVSDGDVEIIFMKNL